jgi:uncharacterized protein (TIGR03435 family)
MPLSSQIVGAPDWVNTLQVNVDARTASGEAITAAQLPAALRAMLEDRFKLKAHTELHPFPAYALVIARKDGRLGPKLRPSTADCFPAPKDMPMPPVPSARCFTGIFRSGTITAPNLTMEVLARDLTQFGGADRIVVDHGVGGSYDGSSLVRGRDAASDDPPLVTAIQEQLGLKLEPGNERLPAVVIDHIEQPSPN